MSKQTWRPIGLTALVTMAVTLVGCGTQSRMVSYVPAPTSTMSQAKAPTTKTDAVAEKAFRDAAAQRGVKLTDAQFDLIKAERIVMPSGVFSPRPAENLTAEQNLDVHFHKHGNEFGISSAAKYLSEAVAFNAGEHGTVSYFFDTTSFAKGYQTHVVRWSATSKEFSAVKTDGAVTTYYRNNSVDAKRFVPVPTF
ncbi:MAG: hypothetical protein H7338_13055 [Candidatus Sericytochromatia bacterium]|nr:hypothetical protein [Candidatus Sericytochromatia bacterium]